MSALVLLIDDLVLWPQFNLKLIVFVLYQNYNLHLASSILLQSCRTLSFIVSWYVVCSMYWYVLSNFFITSTSIFFTPSNVTYISFAFWPFSLIKLLFFLHLMVLLEANKHIINAPFHLVQIASIDSSKSLLDCTMLKYVYIRITINTQVYILNIINLNLKSHIV